MKKQKKQPQMAFCIKINKQKSINANKTKNQHGCEIHNSHKYTKHTHTHAHRGVHLRDTQKYAIKKELTHANSHSSHKCRKWAFAGRVKSVAHIFIAYIFVYSGFFFFRFCICCINCQWNYRIYVYAGETAHSLVRSLRLSRYGQIVAQSVVKQGKLQS